MSNSRIQSKALNAKLSWEIIGLDLAKNDLSFVGITLEGEIIRIDRLSYEQLVEFSRDTDPTTFAMEPCCESHYLTNLNSMVTNAELFPAKPFKITSILIFPVKRMISTMRRP